MPEDPIVEKLKKKKRKKKIVEAMSEKLEEIVKKDSTFSRMIIDPAALDKMFAYSDILKQLNGGHGLECMGYLVAPVDEPTHKIHDIVLFKKQDMTSTSGDATFQGTKETIKELGRRNLKTLGIWHTHGDIGWTKHSTRDYENMSNVNNPLKIPCRIDIGGLHFEKRQTEDGIKVSVKGPDDELYVMNVDVGIPEADIRVSHDLVTHINILYSIIINNIGSKSAEIYYRFLDPFSKEYLPARRSGIDEISCETPFSTMVDCRGDELAEELMEEIILGNYLLKEKPITKKRFKALLPGLKKIHIKNNYIDKMAALEQEPVIIVEDISPENQVTVLEQDKKKYKNTLEGLRMTFERILNKLKPKASSLGISTSIGDTNEIFSDVNSLASYLDSFLIPEFFKKIDAYVKLGVSPDKAREIAGTLEQFEKEGYNKERVLSLIQVMEEIIAHVPAGKGRELLNYNAKIKQELESARTNIEGLQSDLEKEKTNKEGIQVELETKDKALDRAIGERNTAEVQSRTLEGKLRNALDRLSSKERYNNTLLSENKRIEQELKKSKVAVSGLTKKLKGYKLQAERKTQDSDRISSEFEKQLTEIKGELNDRKQEFARKLTEAHAKYMLSHEKAQGLEKELVAANSTIGELRSNLSDANRSAQGTISKLTQERDNYKLQAEKKAQDSDKTSSEFEKQLTEIRGELNDRKQEFARKKEEIGRKLTEANAKYISSHEKAQSLEKGLVAAKSTIGELRSNLSDANRSAQGTISKLTQERDNYKLQAEKKTEELENAKTETQGRLNTLEQEKNQLNEKYETSKGEIRKIGADLATANAEKTELEGKLAHSKSREGKLQQQNTDLEQANKKASEDFQRLSEKIDQIESSHNQKIESMRDAQKTEIERVREALRTADGDYRISLENMHADYEKKLEEKDKKLIESYEINEALLSKSQEEQEDIDNLHGIYLQLKDFFESKYAANTKKKPDNFGERMTDCYELIETRLSQTKQKFDNFGENLTESSKKINEDYLNIKREIDMFSIEV